MASNKLVRSPWFIACGLHLIFSFTALAANGDPSLPPAITEEYVLTKCRQIAAQNSVEQLGTDDMAHLPVAIINNPSVIIAIDSAYATDAGWFFSAYASVFLPGSTKPLAFAAQHIGFNGKGLASSSQMKMVLVTNHPIRISDQADLVLTGDGHNYIEFNCDGFHAINLKGHFLFDDGFLMAESDDATEQVKASFEVHANNLNDIMVDVSITPFRIRGLDDLSFQITRAVVDLSDMVNPSGLSLPQEYQNSLGQDIQLWRGFFLQDLTVRMKRLTDDPDLAPTIQAHNILIDNLGVTGTFSASNLLALSNGSAGGWPLSIDQLSMTLRFNRITAGSLAGNLNIPFLGDSPIPYAALVEHKDGDVNYLFSIATTKGAEYNIPFAGTITLEPGSIITLEKRGGQFIGSARLQGMLKLNHSLAKFNGIKFQDLDLTTRKPYVLGGIFSTESDGSSRTAGFPISIDSISVRVFQGAAAISIGVSLNLDSKGFTASTVIQLLAKVKEETKVVDASAEQPDAKTITRHHWELEKVKINDVSISCQTSAFYLKGRLSLYHDDPVYGTGFKGEIAFKINSFMSNPVKVTAYFGSTSFRYWHLDVYVPTSIPAGGVVVIKGLQGGASSHMKRAQPFQPDFSKIDPAKMTNNPEAATTTSAVYIPDKDVGMSFLAGVTLVIGNDAAINADALLEVTFNATGGLRTIQFTGAAFFFKPSSQRERTVGNKVPPAPVSASLNMIYDNNNKVFHANLKTYMNIADLLKGDGPNNLIGEAVIHSDPKDWYIYIGKPSQMMGVSIVGLASAKSYFMAGTKVESILPPPQEVREVFDEADKGLMRDETSLEAGRGFAFGVHFKTGFDIRINPFYVMLKIGAGADIMLRNYGEMYCEGRSGRVGIDGWYASGQAYVFLKGKVGLRVRGSDFDIVSVGAAALLQAKLPNPTWFKGQLGGHYSILGGLVKGKFKLKLVIGEQCEMITEGGELDNIEVIADLKPDEGGEDINVFTAPQVSFNTAIETEFSMMDVRDNLSYYRVKLAEFSVTQNGAPVAGAIEWNSAKDVAILRTKEILPQKTTLKVLAKTYWEKKTGSGSWEAIRKNGQIDYEIKEHSFHTGTAPGFIPEENVAYSYPVKSQYNFYSNQSGSGYVKLRLGQNYLFTPSSDGTLHEYIVQFKQGDNTIEGPLTYQEADAKVTFAIPANLSRQTVYKLIFIKRGLGGNQVDSNLQREAVNLSSDEENEMSVTSNSLNGSLANSTEKNLYTSAFRTSEFGTIDQKIASITNLQDLFDVAVGNIAVIGKRGTLTETFDEVELRGRSGQTEPLLQIIASPETPWMKQYISPILYDSYPMDKDVVLSWRDPLQLGIKPLKGVRLTNDAGDYLLTEQNVISGTAPIRSGTIVAGYYLSYYSFKDYNDLRNQAAAKYLIDGASAPGPVKKLLAASGFTGLLEGEYPVDIVYVLPGTSDPVFKQRVSIKY